MNVLKYLLLNPSKLVNRSRVFSVLLHAIVKNDFSFVVKLNIRRIICLIQLENFVYEKVWANSSVFEEPVQSLYGSPQTSMRGKLSKPSAIEAG